MKTSIHIFSILDSPAMGGAEKYLLSNLDFLSQQGFKVTLATANKKIKSQYQNKFNLINFPYRLDLIGNLKGVIKFFLFAPVATIWLLKTLAQLKNNSAQLIVYTPGFTERLFFSPLIKLLQIKLIWIEFGPIEAVINRNFKLPQLLYQLTCKLPDKIITISKNSCHSLLNSSRANRENISIIYPGTPLVTLPALKKLKISGRNWKEKNNLTDKNIISFVGRLAKEKEVDLVIKALAQLKNKKCQLIIIGTGPAKTAYQQLTKKLKINHRVTFTDYLTEKQKNTILSISQLFIFPSAWGMEGFGISTTEAMMLGIPVITTGAGPQKEIVTHQKTGLFFKPKDVKNLTLKINQLLNKPTQAKKIGQAGRKIVIKKFSQDLMNQQTLKLIKSVCD